MFSLAELPELVGFFSYSRRDDEHSGGALSRLRARIYDEMRLQLGCDVRLWQDTAAIPHGTLWGDEIKRAIAESAFFIPIVTPSAVASSHCKTEFELFLARETELGRKDLIFPILYIRVPALGIEDQRRQNDVLEIIHAREYANWTKIRQHDVASFDVGKQIEDLCRDIVEALLKPWVPPEERRRKEQAEAQKRADDERQRWVEAEAQRMEDERRRQEEEAKRTAEEERRRNTAATAERQRLERDAAAEREAERRKNGREQAMPTSFPRDGTDPIGSNEAPYFAVSLLKFTVMSICTGGVYDLYWFYKNWDLIKSREKLDIKPFWRAVFAYFFCYECFSKIRANAASLGLHQGAPAGPLAAGWIITTLLVKLPDPYWLISTLSFLFMLPMQVLANRINSTITPHHDPNRRFTAWNLVWIAVGAIVIILAIIVTFMPD